MVREVTKSVVLSLALCAGLLGCGGAQSPAQAPAEAGPEPAEPAASPNDDAAARPELTAEACESSGGMVVGDIGDGAIHKASYRCPSGAAPSGTIRAAEGGPTAVEGSVCCPK